MNRGVNLNYIHHVRPDEHENAVRFLLTGRLPDSIQNPSSAARFARRWRNAHLAWDPDEEVFKIFFFDRELVPENRIEQVLARLYDDPETGGNLGRDKFYYRVRRHYVGITRADVENFVNNDETHQLHRRVFNRSKVVRPLPVPHRSNVRWQQDLIDMGERMHQNRRYR